MKISRKIKINSLKWTYFICHKTVNEWIDETMSHRKPMANVKATNEDQILCACFCNPKTIIKPYKHIKYVDWKPTNRKCNH